MEIESKYQDHMVHFAGEIDKKMNGTDRPREHGFVLLMFGFGEGGKDKTMNYISNADRETVIAALKELVANLEGRMIHQPEQTQ